MWRWRWWYQERLAVSCSALSVVINANSLWGDFVMDDKVGILSHAIL